MPGDVKNTQDTVCPPLQFFCLKEGEKLVHVGSGTHLAGVAEMPEPCDLSAQSEFETAVGCE